VGPRLPSHTHTLELKNKHGLRNILLYCPYCLPRLGIIPSRVQLPPIFPPALDGALESSRTLKDPEGVGRVKVEGLDDPTLVTLAPAGEETSFWEESEQLEGMFFESGLASTEVGGRRALDTVELVAADCKRIQTGRYYADSISCV
jgi:hypothetical protein